MDFKIKEITEAGLKSNICNDILRALPDWFGNEDAIADYVNKVQTMPFYAAFDNETPVGFVAVKVHNIYTFEVCVMGVLEECHRRGIGK